MHANVFSFTYYEVWRRFVSNASIYGLGKTGPYVILLAGTSTSCSNGKAMTKKFGLVKWPLVKRCSYTAFPKWKKLFGRIFE